MEATTNRKIVKKDYSRLMVQVYALLFAVYYVLNIIFPTDYSKDADNTNRLFPQIAAALITGYSLMIIAISYRKIWANKIMRYSMFMLAFACLYIVYPFKPAANISYVMRTYMAIISMFASYALLLKVKNVKSWYRNIYIIYAFQLLFCLSSLLMDRMLFANSTATEFDSNAGFMLITCIPMALTIPYKRLRVYVYAFLVVCCIYCGQRSAALAAVVSFPFCLAYVWKDIKRNDFVILITLGIIVALPILIDSIQNIQMRNETDLKTSDNIGSGRAVFWAIVLQDFFSKGPLHILIGNGTNSVAAVLEREYGLAIGAHNGWLDILYTFGFVGVGIYATVIFSMLRRNKSTNRILPKYKNMYMILFLIFIVKATTSHGYFDTSVIPFMTSIAMIEGMRTRKELYIKHEIAAGNTGVATVPDKPKGRRIRNQH